MKNIYENESLAMNAAQEYQKENGGTIYKGVEDLVDENNRILGTYGLIAVGFGDAEPFGIAWESFYYEL